MPALTLMLCHVHPAGAQSGRKDAEGDRAVHVAAAAPARIGGARLAWINETLGVADSRVVGVGVPDGPVESIRLVLPLDGASRSVTLQRRSVRAPGYGVYEALPGGALRPVEPGAVNTYRGRLDDDPLSVAAAALIDGGLRVTIAAGDGSRFELQPLATIDAGARPGEHVLYRAGDLLDRASGCGTPTPPGFGPAGSGPAAGGGVAGNGGGSGVCEALLGCDADFPFFQVFGSVAAVEDEINAVINAVNVQYETQVGITHLVSGIIVRSSAGTDPYTATNSLDLVCEFSREWSDNVSMVRDAAHLFTNRVTGADIGRAAEIGSICEPESCPFFPCVCNPQFGTEGSYAFSRTEFDPAFACSTDVVAHQLGHLWGAAHCNCPGFTMNPFTTCANVFSQASIDAIEAYRDTVACIDCFETLPNDLCVNAIEIFDGDTPFDSTGATTDGPPAESCGLATQLHNDLWYDYVATCTGTLTVSTCNQAETGFDTVLAAYDGCDCGTLVQLGCNDDVLGMCSGLTSYLQVPVFEGNCYKIRVGGWNSGDFGSATLSIDCEPTGPVNDLCENALALTNGETLYDITGAAGEIEGFCFSGDPTFAAGVYPDIYYTYIADFTGPLTISVCSEDDVNGIEVYGDCACPVNFASCLASNSCLDEESGACPKGCLSEVTIDVVEGGCYLVRVVHMNGIGGGTITVSKPIAPVNDRCDGALPLANGETTYDMTGAAGEEPQLCDVRSAGLGPGFPPDVYFTYEVGYTGLLAITVCTENDQNAFEVFDATTCPPMAGDCIAASGCTVAAAGCTGCFSEVTLDVVPGQSLLIRVVQMNGNGGGTITITKFVESCAGARLDFGVTPDDFGDPHACPTAAAGTPITTQYVDVQSVVFGSAVDSFDPPNVFVVEEAQCIPACRSGTVLGATIDETDWWCQFRFGTAPGVPGPVAGVTSFSAELCPIADGAGGAATMTGYNTFREVVAQASSTQSGTETLSITAPVGSIIAYVQVTHPLGVTVDCLQYPDPQAPKPSLCEWDCGDGSGVVDVVDLLALLADWKMVGVCDFDDDDNVGITDLLAMLEHWGPCPAPAVCGAGAGGCYVDNGTPGCDDVNCCALICLLDPFCCETSWDQLCANQAVTICVESGGAGAGPAGGDHSIGLPRR